MVFDQDVYIYWDLYFASGITAASSLRPVDESGLESDAASGVNQYYHHGWSAIVSAIEKYHA